MNTIELKNKLLEMAADQSHINFSLCVAVVNLIIRQYLVTPGYMEENAIQTMDGFLTLGVINW